MSSFQKFTESVNIKGIKLKNNLPFISSGIPSLDHILGETFYIIVHTEWPFDLSAEELTTP